jgi:hypothetical protein
VLRFFLFLLFALTCAAQNAVIRMGDGVFRVTGWTAVDPPPEGWSSLFAVYAGGADVPPMIGAYVVEGGDLVFRPRFPLAPGMHVRAVFRGIETAFDIPKGAALSSTTRVDHVYPSSDALPENALKLYLYFSAPMQKGDSWKHLSLLREDGSKVEYPFLEVDQELWDRDNRRFTILFDPGRIKRGLASLAEAGTALEAGNRYTLVVHREWLDGRGAPLAEDHRKTFRVTPADRVPPDPAKWRVTPARAGTNDPLVITFPKPLDFALLQHEIEVRGVTGSVEVARGETEWRFTPRSPWAAGDYQIVIRTTLEDLAGNHILRAFDVDTFDQVTRKVTAEFVTLPLRIRR